MSAYPDANFLVRLYLPMIGSAEAQSCLQDTGMRNEWPLPVTELTRLEVLNAFQRLVFECRTTGQFRISAEAAAAATADFRQDLEDEVFVRRVPLSLSDLADPFETLVGRHTAKLGLRTYDILHVASAVHLGCDRFLSFDKNANALARLEGLIAEMDVT